VISIALRTAMERAREAALSGDAQAFPEHLRGIRSLDRSGVAPEQELRLLSIVAAARRADMTAVDAELAAAGSLPNHEWDRVRRWLIAAPEMSIPAYATFVRTLDQRMRQQVKLPPSRRWTPSIVIVLLGALLSLGVLAWRLGAVDGATSNASMIEAVISGRPDALLENCPSAWRADLLEAGRLLAMHDTSSAWGATEAAIDALAKSLRNAAASPAAGRVAETLLGPRATAQDLDKVANGVIGWRDSPWLRVGAWSDRATWSWSPSGDARMAWRGALRHMPLGLWMPGLFSVQWRCETLRDESITVVRTSGDNARISMQAVVGTRNWTIPASRVGRLWIADPLIAQWPGVSATLSPDGCTAARAAACQQSITDALRAVTAWIDRLSTGAIDPAPSIAEVPWWVP